jgi:hypothetical protein
MIPNYEMLFKTPCRHSALADFGVWHYLIVIRHPQAD